MASIIRGPPHIQQTSPAHITTHAAVQAPYSTHVPRGMQHGFEGTSMGFKNTNDENFYLI